MPSLHESPPPIVDTSTPFFFFSSRRRHTRCSRDWVQTCALPIFEPGLPVRVRLAQVDGSGAGSEELPDARDAGVRRGVVHPGVLPPSRGGHSMAGPTTLQPV